jgi:hypothetical protein
MRNSRYNFYGLVLALPGLRLEHGAARTWNTLCTDVACYNFDTPATPAE